MFDHPAKMFKFPHIFKRRAPARAEFYSADGPLQARPAAAETPCFALLQVLYYNKLAWHVFGAQQRPRTLTEQ
jgi:hypothetical protein